MRITAGAQRVFRHSYTQGDFNRFAALTGDDNPIHVDPAYAAGTRFGRTVSHGMLLYSTVRRYLALWLPDHVEISQEMVFPAPTYTDEIVEFIFMVESIAGGELRIRTEVRKRDSEFGLQGTAHISFEKIAGRRPIRKEVSFELVPAFKQFSLGQKARMVRSFDARDLVEYSAVTGDGSALEGRVPGPLIGGMFSNLLGTKLPGPGTNWLKQRYYFQEACCIGEQITAEVEIIRLRPEKELVNLTTVCTGPDGRILCEGDALVLVADTSC